jgi:molybdopterin-guanine dinucleotide biosynthesis protein A
VDIGPLAGIEAVLQYYADEAQYAATLFLPCDMPNITAEAIQKLINQYKLSHAEIVFAATHKEQWHPLCAVINNSVLPKINALIECGVYRVSEAWQNCRAETILFADEKQFANCNSWQDFL